MAVDICVTLMSLTTTEILAKSTDHRFTASKELCTFEVLILQVNRIGPVQRSRSRLICANRLP